MPHVVVKLWPGKSEQQKIRLAKDIAKDVMAILDYGEESVSVALKKSNHEIGLTKVYQPDIVNHPEKLYKKPGYTM